MKMGTVSFLAEPDHFMDEYHSEMKEAEIDEIINEVRERLYKAGRTTS